MVAAVTTQASTHLHAVHLVLADDLDGAFAVFALDVCGAVDVAEGTVAHLLDQMPPLQTGVSREFALALVFFGDDLGQVCAVYVLGRLGRLVLVRFDGVGSGVAGLSGAVLPVGGDRVRIRDGCRGRTGGSRFGNTGHLCLGGRGVL